jgi:cellulose synthase/poly-beta-1,6-N-acetylglucosamine synthase-like glycosyltransferase
VTALIFILLAPFAILTAFFLLEVLCGLPRGGRHTLVGAKSSAVVVIPAHDEATVIVRTLEALKLSVRDGMRVLVVADNCADETAALARECGVEVLERRDQQLRGKGYALAFAADHLRASPPDIFAVLDADCATDAASLDKLVEAAAESGRPSQSINLLRPDRTAAPMVQLSTFGFMLKNLVRQRGIQRLAGRVHLTGTGMAMPFRLFEASGKVRSSVVEDLALGLELAGAGHPPALITDSFVWSGGSTEHGTLTQRRRWEGGYLATAFRQGPHETLRAVLRVSPREFLAGLDLMVPPLALFAALNIAVLFVAAVLTWLAEAQWWPVLVQLALLAMAGGAVFAAWRREGREFISLGVLLRLPLYVLWKLPMYFGLARTGTPKEWLRTGR